MHQGDVYYTVKRAKENFGPDVPNGAYNEWRRVIRHINSIAPDANVVIDYGQIRASRPITEEEAASAEAAFIVDDRKLLDAADTFLAQANDLFQDSKRIPIRLANGEKALCKSRIFAEISVMWHISEARVSRDDAKSFESIKSQADVDAWEDEHIHIRRPGEELTANDFSDEELAEDWFAIMVANSKGV